MFSRQFLIAIFESYHSKTINTMKKIVFVLLFMGFSGVAQVDYSGLVKNLEDITIDTDLKLYFEGLPVVDYHNGNIFYNDSRFLRFYEVTISSVKFEKNRENQRRITITPNMVKKDYDLILANLIAVYGTTEIFDYGISKHYEWITDDRKIYLKNELDNGVYKKLSNITINFKTP